MTADQTWLTGLSGYQFTGAIHLNGHALTVTGNGDFSGVIDGAGAITTNGQGSLTFSGANTYTGRTTIGARSVVFVTTPTAFGAADGTIENGTTIEDGGVLRPQATAFGNEAVALGHTDDGPNGGAITVIAGPSSMAGPITITKDTVVTLPVSNLLTLSGVVSGPGRLSVAGNGTLFLTNSGNALAGGLDLQPGGGPAVTIDAAQQTVAGLTGVGTLSLVAAPSVLTLNGTAVTDFGGTVSGTGEIDHTGTGHQTFIGPASTFSGALHVDHGIVTVSSTLPATVTVNNDGIFSLTGNGTTGAITVNDGHLQLSEGGAATGNSQALTLDSAATLDVGGTAPAMLGGVKVTGAVTLGNAVLNVQIPNGFNVAGGASFTLIDNDGVDPVNGTFAGLPEGATLNAGLVQLRISYVGGTGNDVVLTVSALSYLLSEGATGGFFTTDILLANPNNTAAPVSLTFLKDDGTTVTASDSLPAMSHKLIRVNDVAGMAATSFSTVVRSLDGLPLVVERTMSWDRSGYGAHTEHATQDSSTIWYFAEGSQGFFHTYLLLANPQSTANQATVQYLREGEAPLTRTYALQPTSRLTVDAGADTELVGRSFGMTVTFDQPGAAERAMYFGDVPLFNGGHESSGVPAPSATWFLAEGATGPFFETFVLLANPNDADATATLTYLPAGGAPITSVKTIPGHARLTVNLETESPALANAAVSTQVVSTQPILAERSMYWPDPAPNWYEAHNSFGVTTLGTKWALAEGRVGGTTNAQTYIMLANPGTTDASVSITFLRENGAAAVTKTFTVRATSRFNVSIGSGAMVPELTSENFGALITSDQPIAVEHALYWDANDQIWAAGTDATATRLP